MLINLITGLGTLAIIVVALFVISVTAHIWPLWVILAFIVSVCIGEK
jgi:hypothetical protein